MLLHVNIRSYIAVRRGYVEIHHLASMHSKDVYKVTLTQVP